MKIKTALIQKVLAKLSEAVEMSAAHCRAIAANRAK